MSEEWVTSEEGLRRGVGEEEWVSGERARRGLHS